MHLFELAASTETGLLDTIDGGLDHGTGSLGHTGQVFLRDTAGTENVAVSKVLGGEVTNGELGEDNLGATFMNLT